MNRYGKCSAESSLWYSFSPWNYPGLSTFIYISSHNPTGQDHSTSLQISKVYPSVCFKVHFISMLPCAPPTQRGKLNGLIFSVIIGPHLFNNWWLRGRHINNQAKTKNSPLSVSFLLALKDVAFSSNGGYDLRLSFILRPWNVQCRPIMVIWSRLLRPQVR